MNHRTQDGSGQIVAVLTAFLSLFAVVGFALYGLPRFYPYFVQELGWSRQAATPFHFRTATGREVDIVLEAPGGRVVGIEVKASSAVDTGDFAGLQTLAEAAGKKFVRGVVLYLGEHVVAHGSTMWALPIDELWHPSEE